MHGRTTEINVNAANAALAGIRVVDMSGWSGQYCGKQFVDLGA
jgi:crotonobetainyl-CoA:carnitine CoA-transferase CaiB-like acyl-CoA transferase